MAHLICFPLPLEFDLFVAEIEALTGTAVQRSLPNIRLRKSARWLWQNKQYYFVNSGHGKVNTAIGTTHSLQTLPDISHAFLFGSCGAVMDLNVLDVLIASEVIEHDYKVKFASLPTPSFQGNIDLIKIFQKTIAEMAIKHRVGRLASGDEDILDSERRSWLRDTFAPLGVAWEGAGFAKAAAFFNIPALEMRVVTDDSDAGPSTDFKSNLCLGMKILAKALVESHNIESRKKLG